MMSILTTSVFTFVHWNVKGNLKGLGRPPPWIGGYNLTVNPLEVPEMAKKSLTGAVHKEAVPKRTSVGQGRRKRGSWAKHSEKPSRGQGKG